MFVFVDRPVPAVGARLTAWELGQEGVPHAVVADDAAGRLMRTGQIDMVIVGSDRIAANGDVANKIGTYSSAVCATRTGFPSTWLRPPPPSIRTARAATPSIEERGGDEVRWTWGWSEDGTFTRVRTTPRARMSGIRPSMSPPPHGRGIITEKGVVPATEEGIASVARTV